MYSPLRDPLDPSRLWTITLRVLVLAALSMLVLWLEAKTGATPRDLAVTAATLVTVGALGWMALDDAPALARPGDRSGTRTADEPRQAPPRPRRA